MKRWISWILAAVMILSGIPVRAAATETVAIESITLDRTQAELPEGMTLVLHETVMPEDASVSQIIWTSSDPSVVRLKASGTLEAVWEYDPDDMPKDPSEYKTAVVTVQVGECTASCEITVLPRLRGQKTITVTTGATARLYEKVNYYSYDPIETGYVLDNGDGTTTYVFGSLGSDLSWRVSMEGKITKAGYWDTTQPNLTVLYSGDDPAPNTRVDYAAAGQANASVAEDGVLLNINGQNCLSMSVGQSKTLKAYRVWELIKTFENHVIMPDFHYTILSGNDVVSLEEKASPSNGDGDWMTLTAMKQGTAIIEVTYDAIELSGGSYDGVYGASDPSRTGLMVVQVGGSAAVDFGIESFASLSTPEADYIPYNANNKQAWDAEFDTLYFTGSSGLLKFKPVGATSVAVSNNKGASWTSLSPVNGVYTATIVSGNNILRVTTSSGTAYQVVRGDRVSVRYAEKDGDGDRVLESGETVRVYLDGLHMPIPKISGNYNPGYEANADGYSPVHLNYSVNGTAIHGPGKQYDFITAANYIDVVLPANSTSVTLADGYIGVGVLGYEDFLASANGHRHIPDEGCGMLYGYSSFHTRSILPQITIPINSVAGANNAPRVKADAMTTKTITQGQNFAINPETLFTDPDGDTLTYTVSVDGGAATTATSSYKYESTKAGTFKLTFTASDGEKSVSHTITLTVNQKPNTGGGTGGNTGGGTNTGENTEYGLKKSEIAGYVTIGFEDKGVRVAGETGLKYPIPLGTIISQTKVPFKSGENIAQVTIRLLDHKGIGYSYTGSVTGNFYLASIKNFEVNNTPYDSMGEFDAGTGSGWMITLNGWFIDKSTAAFTVSDGDVIQWKYTCQVGKDIGDTYSGGNGSNQTEANKIKSVEELIKALPDEITEKDRTAVQRAVDAYDGLTDAQKAKVDATLRKKLENARKILEEKQPDTSNSGGTDVTPSTTKAMTVTNEAGEEENAFSVTGNYLATLGTPTVNSIGGEWMVIGLARSGYEVPEDYYDNVIAFVQENINEKQQLHPAKSTENSRLILALTAIGKDVTAVDGHNLLMGLTDMAYLQKQGINGPIWALIAFDSGNYPIPEGNVTRETLIETILAAQLDDGGWALTGEVSDPDMTGMALQALASYYEKDDLVKAAVDKALAALSQMQAEDGSFASIDGPSSESIAQVIVALTALGIDPDQDVRFVKNGNSAWDALLSYYIPGGGFRHVPDGELDGMSTEQGYYAMVSYYRMLEGKTALYDMTDRIDRGGDPVPTETTRESTEPIETAAGEQTEENNSKWVWAGVLGLCGCALAAVLLNWKKLLVFFSRG